MKCRCTPPRSSPYFVVKYFVDSFVSTGSSIVPSSRPLTHWIWRRIWIHASNISYTFVPNSPSCQSAKWNPWKYWSGLWESSIMTTKWAWRRSARCELFEIERNTRSGTKDCAWGRGIHLMTLGGEQLDIEQFITLDSYNIFEGMILQYLDANTLLVSATSSGVHVMHASTNVGPVADKVSSYRATRACLDEYSKVISTQCKQRWQSLGNGFVSSITYVLMYYPCGHPPTGCLEWCCYRKMDALLPTTSTIVLDLDFWPCYHICIWHMRSIFIRHIYRYSCMKTINTYCMV